MADSRRDKVDDLQQSSRQYESRAEFEADQHCLVAAAPLRFFEPNIRVTGRGGTTNHGLEKCLPRILPRSKALV